MKIIIFITVFVIIGKNVYGDMNQPQSNSSQEHKSPSLVPLTYEECVKNHLSDSSRENISLICMSWISMITKKDDAKRPTRYEECVKSALFASSKEDINLKCTFWIFEIEDAKRYTQCVKAGGNSFALGLEDYPIGRSSNLCQMTFYNPRYEFPKNFVECEKKRAGTILGGDRSTINGVLRPKVCLIAIELSKDVMNKDVAKRLIQECAALGGDTSGNIPSCIKKFQEP